MIRDEARAIHVEKMEALFLKLHARYSLLKAPYVQLKFEDSIPEKVKLMVYSRVCRQPCKRFDKRSEAFISKRLKDDAGFMYAPKTDPGWHKIHVRVVLQELERYIEADIMEDEDF